MTYNSILKKLSAFRLGGLFVFVSIVSPLITETRAQDAGALLNVLVKKGVVSDQEAEEIRTELAAESAAAVIQTVSGGKSTTGIAFSGRIQAQYAGLGTDVENAAKNPPGVNHFFLRRIYFGAKATIGANWTANFNYDFAGTNFDKAYLEWAGNIGGAPFAFDIGLRKVNFGYEEYTSSGNLKAIERSGATRYFVEDNNGRRLGAGSYRVGIFADYNPQAFAGKITGFFAGLAITNPERAVKAGNDGNLNDSSYAGDKNNNSPAYWVNVGYSGRSGDFKYLAGLAAGYLPDQGGAGNTSLGAGGDITDFSAYIDMSIGRFQIAAEYLFAKVAGAKTPWVAADQPDNTIKGFWIQPTLMVTDSLELVGRYSYTDTDKRGIRVSDGIRKASGANNGNLLDEYYLGINYYVLGNDLKFQVGYVGGKTGDTGPRPRETVSGIRSQVQVNF